MTMIMRVSPAATQDIEIMHSQEQCLVLQVVPPRTASSRDIAALETVMQGLVLDTHHPIALEIARTESGRQFLLRATTRAALEHLADQIQARYPQATLQQVADDPLVLRTGETFSAVELPPWSRSSCSGITSRRSCLPGCCMRGPSCFTGRTHNFPRHR